MIKAIFFDVDGTLISKERSYISKNVLSALKELRERGIKLFIATGRHYLELEKLGINQQFVFDGYLTLNGGYCFNQEETIYQNVIDKQDVMKIVDYVLKHNLACCFIEDRSLYVNMINDAVIDAQIFLNTPIPPVEGVARALENDIYQLNPFVSAKQIDDIIALTDNCKYTQWYINGFDVISKSSGKKEGIKAMFDYYDLDVDEVMAFGDGLNDIEMLSFVGMGICMDNGHEETKKVCNYVTKAVDEDGIVYALKYFQLI